MTINRPLKVGDKLKFVAGAGNLRIYDSAEVKSIGEAEGEDYAWLLVKRPSGVESLLTFDEAFVRDNWELVPDFFVKGEVYKYTTGYGETFFAIKEVYELDNPTSEWERLFATAEATNGKGKKWITVLDVASFNSMIRWEELEKW